MAFRNFNLTIKAKTWRRDSYGLFDYETTNCNKQTLSSSHPGKLNRTNNQISYSNTSLYPDKRIQRRQTELGPEESLINIEELPEGIRIYSEVTGEEDSNQLWTVVERGENARGCSLQINDVIKLGRVKFRINQIKVVSDKDVKRGTRKSIIDSIKDHMQNVQETFIIDPKAQGNKNSNAGNMCKICLYDKSDEEDDPLISPCKCIGSVRYVHLKCMQNWVKSKLNMQQNKNIITILWKNLNCELCKEKLPITFNHEGEDLSLIPFDNRIAGSYVMLESFSKESDSTGIHLIDLSSNQNFKIGRGHDCDLKISDISVSRLHAMFVVARGKIFLKDNNSKFGTLILKQGPVILNSDNRKSALFQCGRTLFRFSLKKPWIAYLPCFGAIFAPCQPKNQPINQDSQVINEADDETMIRFASEEEIKRERRSSI